MGADKQPLPADAVAHAGPMAVGYALPAFVHHKSRAFLDGSANELFGIMAWMPFA